MKLLLLTFTLLITSLTSFGQDASKSTVADPYMEFRSKNMFQIIESTDGANKGYQVLTEIEYINGSKENSLKLTPEDFIKKFKAGELKSENVLIKRARLEDTWYVLGNTGYVLLGVSENQLSIKYNLTNTK